MRNPHVMTIAGALWPRKNPEPLWKKFKVRHFELAPDVQLRAECFIDTSAPDVRSRPTMIIIHGLEGSSRSPDILNLAVKAAGAKMNVVNLNLRNCGDTLHLCPGLYNGGMSHDVFLVLKELREQDGLSNIFLVGYSLGGNIVLKLGGELADTGREFLRGICAISPAIDLSACVKAIERGLNRFYEQRFLISLKQKIRQKNKLFPGKYAVDLLSRVWKIRVFDDTFTAPDAGYQNAEDYYRNASSLYVLDKIEVPTLMIAAKDDPLVPFEMFATKQMENNYIKFLTPDHGGHGGFLNASPSPDDIDIFWAENRVIQFCSEINAAASTHSATE